MLRVMLPIFLLICFISVGARSEAFEIFGPRKVLAEKSGVSSSEVVFVNYLTENHNDKGTGLKSFYPVRGSLFGYDFWPKGGATVGHDNMFIGRVAGFGLFQTGFNILSVNNTGLWKKVNSPAFLNIYGGAIPNVDFGYWYREVFVWFHQTYINIIYLNRYPRPFGVDHGIVENPILAQYQDSGYADEDEPSTLHLLGFAMLSVLLFVIGCCCICNSVYEERYSVSKCMFVWMVGNMFMGCGMVIFVIQVLGLRLPFPTYAI